MKKSELVKLIGRDGAEAALRRHGFKAGAMQSANTRRNRTRADQKRRAINEG
jgi:hypothetical protein